MPRLFNAFFVSVFLIPVQAHAALDCGVVSAFSRIVALDAGLDTWPPEAADADQIRRDMAQVRPDRISPALTRVPDRADAAVLQEASQLISELAQFAARGETEGFRNLLAAQGTRELFARALVLLAKFSCTPDGADQAESAPSTEIEASSTLSSRVSDVTTGAGLYVGRGLLLTLISLIAIAGAVALLWFINQRRARHRRRARRVSVNRSIDIHYAGGHYAGQILDISCFGAKIRHNGKITVAAGGSPPMSILINSTWREAEIAWHNTNFVGLRFSQPPRRKTIAAFLVIGGTKRGEQAAEATAKA